MEQLPRSNLSVGAFLIYLNCLLRALHDVDFSLRQDKNCRRVAGAQNKIIAGAALLTQRVKGRSP